MPSSRARLAVAFAALAVAGTFATEAAAQQAVQGFGVERFYPSAPGGGWFVMDALDIHGGLGGAAALTMGYAHDPLVVTDGVKHLAVVSDQAFADFGFAGTYDRFRLYVNFDVPLATQGDIGTVGRYSLAGPSVDLGSNPDTLSDVRIGADVRLYGEPAGPLRLGVGAQLFVPNGDRADYDTDGTYRAMFRALAAGDVGLFTYAAQLGVHVRPLDDSPAPGSPQGSEALFGAAAGVRLPAPAFGRAAFVVGPEVYGASAFQSFLGTTSTSLEGLLSGRVEGTADDGPQLRLKLGAGAGLDPHFGEPEWRVVVAIEVFDHGVRFVPGGAKTKP